MKMLVIFTVALPLRRSAALPLDVERWMLTLTPSERVAGFVHFKEENGMLEEFGLASEGTQQAKLAGELLAKEIKAKNVSIETIRICYSPFSRTVQTAKIVANVLGISFESFQCKAMIELRERYFGPLFELLSHDKYAEIWTLDEKDPFTSIEGGESVADVCSRLLIALIGMEEAYQGCDILIVSHGDPLQILQAIILNAPKEEAAFSEAGFPSKIKKALSRHRKYALLTAELRSIAG